MTRKDAVIVSVLVNAGLLMILFVVALTTNHKKIENIKNSQYCCELNTQTDQDQNQNNNLAIKTDVHNDNITSLIEKAEKPQPKESEFEQVKIEEKITHKLPAIAKQNTADKKTQESGFYEITVKKGDSLERIAKNNNTTVFRLKEINDLTSNFLKIGQVLLIDKSNSQKVVKTVSEKKEVEYYTVKVGDNPWTIAMKNHIKLNELLKLNNLDNQKAKRLKPGDKLRIR